MLYDSDGKEPTHSVESYVGYCSNSGSEVYIIVSRSDSITTLILDFHSVMLLALTVSLLIDHTQAYPIQARLRSSSGHDTRSIWDIIWSSLVTLFACIWVAVHPNVRPPMDGTLARMKERVKLLLTALIAPEIIISFSMRQWVCAREVMRSDFGRKRGWTRTHGFFVIMGGFMLYDSKGHHPLYPLDLKNIETLVQRGSIDVPEILEEEIWDRSKGDLISKGLAVIQTGWFIMQCIARGAEHFAITELEIMTVAFTILNLVTYVFWWNKPLNVTCPVRIVLKEGHSVTEPRPPGPVSFWDRFGRMFTLIEPNRDGVTHVDLLQEKRVPTFYAGRIAFRSWSYSAIFAVEVIVAVVFGGIHCVAWSFSFPTRVEQILWRASSVAIISLPFHFLVASVVKNYLLHLQTPEILERLATSLLCLIYILARLFLLILSFISLRSLPPSAFYTVRWTTFIPHV